MTSPHLTAWDYEPTREEGCSFIVYPATSSEPLAYVAQREGAEDIAKLMAAAPVMAARVRQLEDVLLDLLGALSWTVSPNTPAIVRARTTLREQS